MVESHGGRRQKRSADVQRRGSQPEVRNSSSPSSQSGLRAGGEAAPHIQGTEGSGCGEAQGVKMGRSGDGDFADASLWELFLN